MLYNQIPLQQFVNDIVIENTKAKQDLQTLVTNPVDVVWYPGCGNDLSPCTVLDKRNFEEIVGIATLRKRLYIFVDPDQYGLCKKSFAVGDINNFVDISSTLYPRQYISRYKILSREKITFKSEAMVQEVSGYYLVLALDQRRGLGYKKCTILYFNMTMQDFFLKVIKNYWLDIKWLFYLNMETKGGRLFNLYVEHDLPFPQWICANRISKFGIEEYTDWLESMENTIKGDFYSDTYFDRYMYGQMKNWI